MAVSLAVCRVGVAVLKVPLYKVFIHELWYLIISNENAKGENKKNPANTENISNDLQSDTYIFLNYLPRLLRIFPLLTYNWRRREQNDMWEHYVLVTVLGSRTFNIFLLFKFILSRRSTTVSLQLRFVHPLLAYKLSSNYFDSLP